MNEALLKMVIDKIDYYDEILNIYKLQFNNYKKGTYVQITFIILIISMIFIEHSNVWSYFSLGVMSFIFIDSLFEIFLIKQKIKMYQKIIVSLSEFNKKPEVKKEVSYLKPL